MRLLHCFARQLKTRLCNSLPLKLIACPCRLTGLTSLHIHLRCIRSLPPLQASELSQLGRLEELLLEGYTTLHGDLLAHLPLSLTSLSLLDKTCDDREHTLRMVSMFELLRYEEDVQNGEIEEEEEEEENIARIAMGQLANLQHFKFCGDCFIWAQLLGPLASISGLSDLDVDFYDLQCIACLSRFGHLTRLRVSRFAIQLNAGMGHIGVFSGL